MSNTALPNYAELTPRYGRDYTRAADVKADFFEGRDFTFAFAGQATSIRDVAPGQTVLLRYKRLTMVTTVKVTRAQIDAAHAAADGGLPPKPGEGFDHERTAQQAVDSYFGTF